MSVRDGQARLRKISKDIGNDLPLPKKRQRLFVLSINADCLWRRRRISFGCKGKKR